MAEDKKKSDEYEYPPEEYYKGGEYIPPHETDESLETEEEMRSSLISRRIFSMLGILAAIAIVYFLLMYLNARRRELAQPTPTVETGTAGVPAAASTPAQVLAPEAVPAAPTAPAISGPSAAEQAAMQNAALQATQQSISDLQNQVQRLQAQVSEVTSSVATLTNQMQVIANEIRAIAIERDLKTRGISLINRGKAYTLKALVPGRAWLQARDGSTTTVTIGDRLPGYGIIHMINTDQGIVTTSSGAIIQYGPRDN